MLFCTLVILVHVQGQTQQQVRGGGGGSGGSGLPPPHFIAFCQFQASIWMYNLCHRVRNPKKLLRFAWEVAHPPPTLSPYRSFPCPFSEFLYPCLYIYISAAWQYYTALWVSFYISVHKDTCTLSPQYDRKCTFASTVTCIIATSRWRFYHTLSNKTACVVYIYRQPDTQQDSWLHVTTGKATRHPVV